jgi:hypothetical protein
MEKDSYQGKTLGDLFYKPYKLELNTGREVWLTRLEQYGTYMSQLEGIPFEIKGRVNVKWFVQWAQEAFKLPVAVLQPLTLPHDEKYTAHIRKQHRMIPDEEEIVYLAPITCVAKFWSGPVDGIDAVVTGMVVIWFQEQFAMPIDERAMKHLKQIKWDEYAENCEP